MLKQQAKLINRVAVLTDLLGILAAFVMAFHLRSRLGDLNNIRFYVWVLLVAIPVWYFLLARYGLYASLRTKSVKEVLVSLLKIHVIGGVVTSSAIYLIEPQGFSRGLFSYFILFSFAFLAFEKFAIKLVLFHLRRKGYNFRNLVIVGTTEKAREFIRVVDDHANWGMRIVGLLQLPEEGRLEYVDRHPVIGKLSDLVDVCKSMTVDEVVFCLPKEALPAVEEHLRDMEEMGVTVRMVLDFYNAPLSRRELTLFHDEIPILTVYSTAFDADQLFLKRCLDIAGALVGLAITGVLMPFIVLAIRLDSPGPIFFGQRRVGERGRTFICWKFRSMYVDAEARKKELMARNEMSGAIFKIKDDPRITGVGRFLRDTSLDELPQFWNVLRGEMSLVGTRPPTPDEVACYENWHRKRICIKPGITGLWQVSGRNRISDFDDVVRLDLEYIERWSLWLDIRILFRTVWVVIARRGSC